MASRLSKTPSLIWNAKGIRHKSTAARRRPPPDETTLAGAQHKISGSMSTPSFGHLIAELSATKPGMEHLRQPGQTITEEHRTMIRSVAKWLMGVPVVLGTAIVGANYFLLGDENKT